MQQGANSIYQSVEKFKRNRHNGEGIATITTWGVGCVIRINEVSHSLRIRLALVGVYEQQSFVTSIFVLMTLERFHHASGLFHSPTFLGSN